ncbi:MAG: thiamine phosphate synthase [Pirellulales bacterium]
MQRWRSVQFTPAAERALRAACDWSSAEQPHEVEAPELLLGLLAEPECRAAVMLAHVGIRAPQVADRWPQIRPLTDGDGQRSQRLSAEVRAALAAAQTRLGECLEAGEFATEHLLLGLVAADDETGQWLRDQGLSAERLESEVRRIYGFATNHGKPIDLDEPPPTEPGLEPASVVVAAAATTTPLQAPTEFVDHEVALLRVLDAAANRASEGLRVIEDWVRFALDDRHLTGLCKQLRHDLAAALADVPRAERLRSRDTLADVGAALSTPREGRRATPGELLAANFQRVQEALRSLEEHAKLLGHGSAAVACEALRYRTYTLERAVDATLQSLEFLAHARLYVLVDGGGGLAEAAAQAASLAAAGVHLIQLRAKGLADHEVVERAQAMKQALVGSATLLILNDRPDLTRQAGADGVHLGQEDLSVKAARALVGSRALIGVSIHTLEQARQAVLAGASYLGVGPTFPSQTKHFEAFAGLELVRQVAAEIRLPAFAIGGIDAGNVAQVKSAGLGRVAVSAAIARAPDPAAAAGDLLARLR